MAWFKVDDAFYRSGKVRKLGKDRVPAVGLWTLAGGWSADNLTDGFVPWEVIDGWDLRRNLSRKLIAVGLWIETEHDGEAGISFHDWQDWQPTREQVVQRRKADAERRARWRDGKRHAETNTEPGAASPLTSQPASRRDTPSESQQESQQESRPGSALPGPARPDPTLKTSTAAPAEVSPDRARDSGGGRAEALVDAWTGTHPGVTADRARDLTDAVARLLDSGADPALIPEALTAAHDPHWRNPVAALPHAYEDTRRNTSPHAAAAPRSTTDQRVADAQALKTRHHDHPTGLRALPGGA